MKILLCYAYADLNKGDSAICLGAKEFLKEVYPHAEVDLLNFAYKDEVYANLTKTFYLSLGDNIIDRPHVGMGKASLLKNKLLSIDKNNIKKILIEGNYDLVIMNGGHFIYSKNNALLDKYRNGMRLDHVFNPIYAAKELGIKAGVLGQSIGPINNDSKCLKIIKDLDFIITRENRSSSEVNQYFKSEIARPHIDLAFFMDIGSKKNEVIEKNEKVEKNYIAINLRKVVASGGLELNNDEYLQQFNETKKLVEYILENTGKTVCLFSQVKGYKGNSGENDEDIHKEFKSKFFNDEERVIVKHLDSSENKIIDFYKKKCSLLVSTRFHGLIFSLLADTPTIAYNVNGVGNKILGLYKDLGLEAFVYKGEQSTESLIDIFKKLDSYPHIDVINEGIKNKKKRMQAEFMTLVGRERS